jgi:hypothetical protein
MSVPRTTVFRLLLAATALGGFVACDTDGPGRPGYNFAGPIQAAPTVTVTSSRATMQGDNTTSAAITVTARNASGGSVSDLTVAHLTTNIGHFGSAEGPTAIDVEFFGGAARTVFFSGTVEGTAFIRAEVNGGVGQTTIRINCPDEGCVPTEEPPFF